MKFETNCSVPHPSVDVNMSPKLHRKLWLKPEERHIEESMGIFRHLFCVKRVSTHPGMIARRLCESAHLTSIVETQAQGSVTDGQLLGLVCWNIVSTETCVGLKLNALEWHIV